MPTIDFSGFNFGSANSVTKGMFSKIDMQQVFEKINQSNNVKIDQLDQKINKNNAVVKSLNDLKNNLSELKLLLFGNGSLSDTLTTKIAKTDDEGKVIQVILANYKGQMSNFLLEDIKSAKKSYITIPIKDVNDPIDVNGTIAIENKNGSIVTINFSASDSYKTIIDQINESNFLKAVFVHNVGSSNNSYTLFIETINYGENESLTITSDVSYITDNVSTTNGRNASIILNGMHISAPSNLLTPIDGLQITVLKDSIIQINVNIEIDKNSIKDKINQFITKYNDIQNFILLNKNVDLNSTDETKGILAKNRVFLTIVTKLEQIYLQHYSQKSLHEIGIIFDTNGKISISDNIFFGTNFHSNSDIFQQFLWNLFSTVKSFADFNGVIDVELQSIETSTESASKRKSAADLQVQNKKRKLMKNHAELEGKIAASEEMLKMIDSHIKQLAK